MSVGRKAKAEGVKKEELILNEDNSSVGDDDSILESISSDDLQLHATVKGDSDESKETAKPKSARGSLRRSKSMVNLSRRNSIIEVRKCA